MPMAFSAQSPISNAIAKPMRNQGFGLDQAVFCDSCVTWEFVTFCKERINLCFMKVWLHEFLLFLSAALQLHVVSKGFVSFWLFPAFVRSKCCLCHLRVVSKRFWSALIVVKTLLQTMHFWEVVFKKYFNTAFFSIRCWNSIYFISSNAHLLANQVCQWIQYRLVQ